MDPVRHDSIGAAVRRSAVRVPHEIALRFGEGTWTYEAPRNTAGKVLKRELRTTYAEAVR